MKEIACVANLQKLATKYHEGAFRKNGKTPYIEHPHAVVAQLEAWGVTDPLSLAVAWGHDLLEDTGVSESEIVKAAGKAHGMEVLAGIQLLTFRPSAAAQRDPELKKKEKTDYLFRVAKNAPQEILIVKIADRLCNTREFLALGDAAKAKEYLKAGAPLFGMLRDADLSDKVADVLDALRGRIDATAKPAEGGRTEIVFVVDRSGSMSPLASSTIHGFNEVLEKQRGEPGEALVSTVLFDHEHLVLHDHVDIREVRPITRREYTPRGSTALLDALGRSITHMVNRQRHAPEKERAGRVMFVVITDGYENASREYTAAAVRAMVEKERTKYGWEFLFLGANIDAPQVASAFGMDAALSANLVADDEGVGQAYKAVGAALCCARRCKPGHSVHYALRKGGWRRALDADFAARGARTKHK